jgi:four helix bundle protein
VSDEERHAGLRERTKAYASRIIRLYAHIQQTHRFDDAALVLAKQLLRSGTSVAANHREAKHSRSKADRTAKFQIILQELEESALWLELLHEHNLIWPMPRASASCWTKRTSSSRSLLSA